jgi:nucleoside-diphosphate-sugar epimerase
MPVRFQAAMHRQPDPLIVTGASGFVGRVLAAKLPCVPHAIALGREEWRASVDAAPWRGSTVYHLAARAHRDGRDDAPYQRDNVEKTIALAEAAAAGGAERFVFLSSITVLGSETRDRPFAPGDAPAPTEAYGRSKRDAEQALVRLSQRTGLALVIVRSPLVVGAHPAGNLRTLLRFAHGPWPLPLGGIENRRTMVCVEDLARLLVACGTSPNAPGRTFHAGDPAPISTSRLVAAMRRAWGRSPGLFAVGPGSLEALAAVVGRGSMIRRLTRSLEVDVTATLSLLGWRPAIDLEAGIEAMAREFHVEPGRP